jgi:hypothetical protein
VSRISTVRKVLLSLMIIGATGSTIGAGTHASFNAETTNESEFVTGAIVLKNVKDAGTDLITGSACFSTGGDDETDANHQVGCQRLINVEVKRPGDLAYADLTVSNEGNLDGDLFLQASQACVTAEADGDPYVGTGDACGATRIMIQEYSSTTNRTNNVTAGGTCWYGGGALTSTCSLNSSYTLSAFSTSHPSSGASPVDMGATAGDGERVLRITVEVPANSPNDLQGVQAGFGFTWTLVQQS